MPKSPDGDHPAIDGRIRLRCRVCGAMSAAIYRYFPGTVSPRLPVDLQAFLAD